VHLPPADTRLGPLSTLYSNTNASDVLINPSLGGTWMNVKGEKQTSGVTLKQFEAVIAIRDGSKLSAKIKIDSQGKKKLSQQLKLRKILSTTHPQPLFRDIGNGLTNNWRDTQGRISK